MGSSSTTHPRPNCDKAAPAAPGRPSIWAKAAFSAFLFMMMIAARRPSGINIKVQSTGDPVTKPIETDDKSSNERTDHPPHDGRIEFASHLKDVSNLLKKTTLIRFGGFFALFCFNLVSLAAGLLLGLDCFVVLFWRL